MNPSSSTSTQTLDDDMGLELKNADLHRFENIMSITVPTIFAFIVLIGIVGNIMVILVVRGNTKLKRNPTHILIINLACTDILFLLICVTVTGVGYRMGDWPFGNNMCKVVQYLIYVTAYASIFTLVLMSLDRYLAVAHPIFSVAVRTKTHTYGALSVCWILVLAINVPILFVYELQAKEMSSLYDIIFQINANPSNQIDTQIEESFKEPLFNITFFSPYEQTNKHPWALGNSLDESNAALAAPLYFKLNLSHSGPTYPYPSDALTQHKIRICLIIDKHVEKVIFITFFAFAFVLPLILISLLYVAMLRSLWTKSLAMKGARKNPPSNLDVNLRGRYRTEGVTSRRRITKLVITIVSAFALCWLPIHMVLLLIHVAGFHDKMILIVQVACQCLAYTNSCINPILYSFLSDNFRDGFFKLVMCSRRGFAHQRRNQKDYIDNPQLVKNAKKVQPKSATDQENWGYELLTKPTTETTNSNKRIITFLEGNGPDHFYTVHVNVECDEPAIVIENHGSQ